MTMDSASYNQTSGADVDQALLDNFKGAAFAVTQLYKESLKQNRKSYQAGYSQCLTDLWQFISQQGFQQPSVNQNGGTTTVVSAVDLARFLSAKHQEMQGSTPSPSRTSEEPQSLDNDIDGGSARSTSTSVLQPTEPQHHQQQQQQQQQQHQHQQHQRAQLPQSENHQPPIQLPQSQFTFTAPFTPAPTSDDYLTTTTYPQSRFEAPTYTDATTESNPGFGANESLKRRWDSSFSLFGRTINMDSREFLEPALKRSRRRDDRMSD
ncbi:hypothetical protein HDV00_012046 [Rhizophlyctis rosea]|nr:hypothetical protein HDV00_012046 [Rhizophlyctis rosea]